LGRVRGVSLLKMKLFSKFIPKSLYICK
jgi:hypothetical protein